MLESSNMEPCAKFATNYHVAELTQNVFDLYSR